MRCSVVIPCFNGVALTRVCLQALLAQQPTAPAEILVVDNGSTDATAELGAMHPSIRVVRLPQNLGFAGGVNAGIRSSRCPHVLVLNNDTQADSHLLHELQSQLLANAGLGAVAPVSNHVKGQARIDVGDLGSTAAGRAAITAELRRGPPLQDVDTLAGLCLLVPRALFDEVGLFDERFGHGNFEDDDFSLRLRLHGYRLGIARHAFLHHEGHATFRALGLDLRQELERRRLQFVAKWQHDPAGRAHLAAWHGDHAAASEAALQARTRWPNWLDADWHLGNGHRANEHHALASRHYEAVLRSCPEHVEAHLALAMCWLELGDAAGAITHLTAANQHALADHQRQKVLTQLGSHAYRHGAAADALLHFRAALRIAPDDGSLHNWIGLCLLAADDLQAAQTHFETALQHGCALAHTNLGICQARRGEMTAARASFTKATVLVPHDLAAARNLAALDLATVAR